MVWFDNLRLRTKLLFNFVASSGILIAAIIVCYVQIDRMDALSHEMSDHTLPSVTQAASLSEGRMRYRIRSLEYMLADSAAEREKLEASLVDIDTKLAKSIEDYRQFATKPRSP